MQRNPCHALPGFRILFMADLFDQKRLINQYPNRKEFQEKCDKEEFDDMLLIQMVSYIEKERRY